jgi:Tol biopolymer transport system component/DNA-binding winged helix-turn-helix (wHTH) protein
MLYSRPSPMNPDLPHLIRFAPFEVDTRSCELRRQGLRVKLQEQPFQVLLLLLERSGEVVTREELSKRLWPDNTFIDVERGLNKAINKLRDALRDDAENPRFVETLPQHGYRFIAAVERPVAAAVPPLPEVTVDRASAVKPSSARFVWLISLSLVVALAGLFTYRRLSSSAQVNLPPMKVVPLTSLPGTKMTPAFSADGNQIAFAWKRTGFGVEIYVKLVNEGEPRQLTSSGKVNFNPVWSPDGQRIAFVRSSEVETAIYTISAYGESERKLLSLDGGAERRITWSPNGELLAFADSDKKQPARGTAIYTFSLQAQQKLAVTSPPQNYSDEGPAFSPDGRLLAFVRGSHSDQAAGFDLYVVPASGGKPRRLTLGEDIFWTGPTWTQDGRELVFSSKLTGTSALWRISASGGPARRLEVGSEDSIEPSISARGRRLAYMRFPLDVNIYRAVLQDAKNPAEPPAPFLASTRRDADAHLSLDGKRVAFVSNRSGTSQEIWVCGIDGSNCAAATSFATWAAMPRWSPDGKQIVCEASKDSKTSVYVIDLETRNVRRLLTEPVEERVPSWSRDGRWIFFASSRGGNWQIWKALASGSAPESLTKRGGFRPVESNDSRFIYYARDGGVWKIPAAGGDEVLALNQPKLDLGLNWSAVDNGIYFIRFNEYTDGEGTILFYDFATAHVKEIARLGRHHILGEGLTVSADRRSFFYNVWEHPGGDVMLVENFR